MSISLFSFCLIIKHYQAGYKCQTQKPLFTKKSHTQPIIRKRT